MSDLLTSSYHAIGNYGAMYGCISYKYTNYDTYTRIYIYWLGEGLKTTASDASSTYFLSTSATITGEILIGSTSKKSWSNTASGTRSGYATYSSYVWFKAGGSDANYYDIARTSSNQTVTIKVTYTVSGYSAKTGTTTITVPKAETYTITYNGNGATSGSMSNTTYTYASSGTTTLRANTFRKTGYDFLGWNLDQSQTVKYTDEQQWSLSNKGNYTLYAVWKKDIIISYNANGGTGIAPSNQSATVYNSTTSSSFNIAANTFTRANYEFTEWNTEPNGSGTTYQPNTSYSFSESKTLNAIWESTFVPPELTISSIRNSNNTNSATIELNWTKGSIGGSPIDATFYKIQYKKYNSNTWSGDTAYTRTTGTSSSRSITVDDVQYDVKVSIYSEDHSDTIVSKTDFISAAFFTIDITADGKGIGLLTSAPTVGINIGNAIKGLAGTDLTASGSGGIAIGARSSTNTISSAGSGSIASGFAQGGSIEATTKGAFAGGLADGNNKITASGTSSFAFGQSNSTAALTASGNCAIAMGLGCTASGAFSLAHNMYNTAAKRAQTVIGTWNTIDNNTSSHPAGTSGTNAEYGKYAFIIGNGTGANARSNAFAVNWNGTIEMNNAPMADWVVEEGPVSSPTWWKYYRKWNSGLFELDGYYSGAPTTGSHYSEVVSGKLYGYRSENYSFPSVCVPIDTNYTVLASWKIGSGFAFDCGTVATQTTERFNIYAIGTHGSQSTIAVKIYVRGRWK